MKKRFLIVTLVLTLLMAAPAYAISPRAPSIQAALTFEGTTATCQLAVHADHITDEIYATVELRKGNTSIDSWEVSGAGIVSLKESASVVKGNTYTLVANVSINGTAYSPYEISRVCK